MVLSNRVCLGLEQLDDRVQPAAVFMTSAIPNDAVYVGDTVTLTQGFFLPDPVTGSTLQTMTFAGNADLNADVQQVTLKADLLGPNGQPGLDGVAETVLLGTPVGNNRVTFSFPQVGTLHSFVPIEVTAKVAATADGTITFGKPAITGTRVAPLQQRGAAANPQHIVQLAGAAADLVMSVRTSATQVRPGGSFVLTFSVRNNGPATSHVTVMTITLPPGFSFTNIRNPNMVASGNVLRWTIGSIRPGGVVSLPVTMRILPFSLGGTLLFGSSVLSQTTDPNAANNVAGVAVTIL